MASPRRYSDSSDDENPKKRRKLADKLEIEERLESLISRVGDRSTSSSLESNLEGLASVLEADLENHKKEIFKIILNCAIDLPQRLTVYTTLVGLLNAANYSAGGDFIDMLMVFFKDSLKRNNYTTSLHLMRFLSDLVNCKVVMPSSILNFYNVFLEEAYEEGVPQTRSDWLVYAVLSCLPWSGRELSEKKEVELDRLMASVERYLERRNRDFLPALSVWTEEGEPPKDKLDSIWTQLQDMRQSNWRERMLRRPYGSFENAFRDALQHTIPAVTMPPYDRVLTPLPQVVFRIFEYSDISDDAPRLPKIHSVERFVVEETIHSIIHATCNERKVCADTLLNVEFKEKVPINYLIIEAIFGQMFTMPNSPHVRIMYGVLLIELCRLQPTTLPPVLAQATMILYNKLDNMNVPCIQRFSEWFSYHLSQFQFKWFWEDCVDCIEQNLESPKSRFVQETFKKCLRLSYYQRVTDTVPSNYGKLLPPDPQPMNKYLDSQSDIPGKEYATRVMDMLKSKCSVDDMNSFLSQIKDEVTGDAGNNRARIDIFLQNLLYLASKTPSHTFAAIAKYHSTLKSLTEGRTKMECQQLQVCLLHSLHGVWVNKPQMLVIIIDKFLRTQVVSCSAVVSWIFTPEMAQWLTSFHIHEILESTVNKLKSQVEKEKKELVKSGRKKRNDVDDMDSDDQESSANLEKFENELELVQSSILENLISTMMEHINSCQVKGRPPKAPRYDCLKDRLKEHLLKYNSSKLLNELKSKYYETNLHLSILKVFEMVQPLLN